MRHSILSINELNKNIVDFSTYEDSDTNIRDIKKMKQILCKALKSELTERQRQCVTMYYYDDMKMKEIASTLSLSPSTVTRHIKAAQRKLKNVAKYY